MEFYRLSRETAIDYTGNVFEQLTHHFLAHQKDVYRLIDGVNELHRQGQMSSQDQGWNVVHSLYKSLGINRDAYFGGEVILAPFDVATIAHIPKTVYAFNPIFFVCESFAQMDALLDSYLKPIALRN
jgi:hypothetical protein